MKIHIIMCTKKQTPHEKPTKVITTVSRFEWLTKFCTATSLYMNNSRSEHQVEGILMKLFVVVVVDVVVVVVFLTETNDTTKRVDFQQVSLIPPPPPPLVESRKYRVS